MENLRELISEAQRMDYSRSKRDPATILQAILRSGSPEIYRECEEFLVTSCETGLIPKVIGATAGSPNREQLLLSLWEKIDLPTKRGPEHLGSALRTVALTTCSVRLAKTLIEYGAVVDQRLSGHSLTPLQYAARRTSAEAAELMKFFLFSGADPNAKAPRAKLKISEEKGAQGISKWLGMSWDELVAKAKEERGKAT